MTTTKTWQQKNGIEIDEVDEDEGVELMARSCETCASRGDCWILNINEYRSPLGDPYFTYVMALQAKASRGECLLYTSEEEY